MLFVSNLLSSSQAESDRGFRRSSSVEPRTISAPASFPAHFYQFSRAHGKSPSVQFCQREIRSQSKWKVARSRRFGTGFNCATAPQQNVPGL